MKDRNNAFLKFLLTINLIVSIAYFGLCIVSKENNTNYIPTVISSLLLAVFSTLFIIAEYNNNSKKKGGVYVSSLIFLAYLGFSIFNNLNSLPSKNLKVVKDFTNKSLTDVIKWSKANNVSLEQIYEYSDITGEYKIINQSVKENTLLKDIKKFVVVISDGPNPDKDIILPNMTTWNVEEVIKSINKYHLNNVKVNFEESDKVKNTLIEQSKSGSIKRSDEINLVFSLGEEFDESEVKLINLEKKTLLEAEVFFKQNRIDYEIEYEFSDKIKAGKVIKVNKEVGEVLNRDEKIKIIISKGKEIKVPNLKNYDITKITEWAITNKLKLEFTDQYDDKVKANKVISTNYNKGDSIEEKTLIKVVLSKGKLVMGKFNSLDSFKEWASKYNIKYEEQYEFSDKVKSGEVISYSHKKGDTIKNDDTIIVKISQGEKTTVPNVVGKTKDAAVKLLEKANLKYNFVYSDSTKEKNIVLKQSLNADNEVAANTSITITLSSGKEPTTKSNNTNQNKTSNSSSKNTNSNNSSNNTTEPVTSTCDKSITGKIYIYPELVESGNPTTTCNSIKQAYPKFKFNCTYQSGTGMSAGLLINSNSIDNHSFNYCDTITLKIAQN